MSTRLLARLGDLAMETRADGGAVEPAAGEDSIVSPGAMLRAPELH